MPRQRLSLSNGFHKQHFGNFSASLRGISRTGKGIISMILVTGGAGYIGSQFVRYYARCRPTEKVVILDNLVEGHLEALDGLSNVHFERADIGDFE